MPLSVQLKGGPDKGPWTVFATMMADVEVTVGKFQKPEADELVARLRSQGYSAWTEKTDEE